MEAIAKTFAVIITAIVLLFVNITVINAFAHWAYSQPIGTEGKVVIGIVAVVAEAGEVIGLLSLFKK